MSCFPQIELNRQHYKIKIEIEGTQLPSLAYQNSSVIKEPIVCFIITKLRKVSHSYCCKDPCTQLKVQSFVAAGI